MRSNSLKYALITTSIAVVVLILWKVPSCDEIKFRKTNPKAYHQYQTIVNDYESREVYECESCGIKSLYSMMVHVDESMYCLDCISNGDLFDIKNK